MTAPHIDHFAFGSMTVDGQSFKDDVTIVAGTASGEWWRTQGHLCQGSDLEEVFEARPKLLVIGTGSSGAMRVSYSVEQRCKKLGIRLSIAPTEKAVQEFNRLAAAGENVAGAFHLTC